MRFAVSWTLVLPLILAACKSSPPVKAPVGPPEPYVRLHQPVSNVFELQIAVRQFAPVGRGPGVWLAGVSHVGESNYYAALQNHLASQTLVLFEGVGEHHAATNNLPSRPRAPRPTRPKPDPGQTAAADKSSLQSSLAASLGLAFQLEAIDYDQPNFRNSDLSIPEIRRLMADAENPGGSGATVVTGTATGTPSSGGSAAGSREGGGQSFEALLQLMEGNSIFSGLVRMGLTFLSASPKMQALAKLAMIETIVRIQGDPSQLKALPPNWKQLLDVLIQKRNQKVLDDLAAEIKRGRRAESITVFYGTGHMPDLERHLRDELHYLPARQLWFTAMSVDLAKAGVSNGEAEFMRSMIQRQLDQVAPAQ